jgi:hypothetical protein
MRQALLIGITVLFVLLPTVTNGGSGGQASHYIFLTSVTYQGDLGGLSGADALCASHAASGSLTSQLNVTWRALLSIHGVVDAKDRVSWAGAVYDVSGDLATNDAGAWPWVQNGPSTIDVDENGDPPPDSYVWTGSDVNGTSVGPGYDCNGWTDGTSAYDGWSGETGNFDNSTWIDSFGNQCDDEWFSLYCVSESDDLIFADGFESGDTTAWSNAVP